MTASWRKVAGSIGVLACGVLGLAACDKSEEAPVPAVAESAAATGRAAPTGVPVRAAVRPTAMSTGLLPRLPIPASASAAAPGASASAAASGTAALVGSAAPTAVPSASASAAAVPSASASAGASAAAPPQRCGDRLPPCPAGKKCVGGPRLGFCQ